MAKRRRASIRLWQTELFVIVIVVAMLILSGSLSAGLKSTLTRMAETTELRSAASIAKRLEPEFPVGVAGLGPTRDVIAEYRDIFGGGIWVYDGDGELLESSHDGAPLDGVLESARIAGLNDDPSYAVIDLRSNGWVVAAKAMHGPGEVVEGAVVTASPADQSFMILESVRDRLWVTFWVSLVIAGLLGLGFSELISRRIRAMTEAAAAIAAGDFKQRLSTGFDPYEIQDLAESYNGMAAKLGEVFDEVEGSRKRIAAVVESMAEGVVALDAAGIVNVANSEAARLLTMTDDELMGSAAGEISTEDTVLDIVASGLAGERASDTIDLGQFVVLIHCTPLLNADGKVDGAVLLLADVTERHRMEDAQRRFVADASHEMRTPIAALKGMLELLSDGAKEVPEVRDDFINTMQDETDRLGRLVADLLTLARLEAGSLQLDPAPEYVTDILRDVANVMQPLAEQVEVTLSVESDEDLKVLADRDKIVQVLLGFTDNALKHSPPNTTVHLHAEAIGQAIRFQVTDEGTGIEPEEISRVFERFYRADTARAGGGGTGLGLAIAKEIVEAHDSEIEVSSAPNEGTTFGFDLPRA